MIEMDKAAIKISKKEKQEEEKKKRLYLKYFFYKIKKLTNSRLNKNSGRNYFGRVCVFHRGGGKKRLYNQIDIYKRINEYGTIIKVYKQPKRSGLVGIIMYYNTLVSYIVISEHVYVGSVIFNGNILPIEYEYKKAQGWTICLKYLNLFSIINNIEKVEFNGSNLARAAGVSAVLSTYKRNKFTIKLRSGWQINISQECLASLGKVSNIQHRHHNLKKAGTVRHLGFRPTVRGVIKNPCDHPHGGGEGKGSPPRAQVSPWGKLTKGTPTNNKKKDRLKRRLYKSLS